MTNKSISFNYTIYNHISELKDEYKNIVLAAQNICKQAYAPYSNFLVGAAILLKNGEVITGVNIENASYPVGTCAERVAIGNALAQFPNEPMQAIAISYINKNNLNKTSEPLAPCGMCRQMLLEMEHKYNEPIKLLLTAQQGEIILINTAEELLPLSFSGKNLK